MEKPKKKILLIMNVIKLFKFFNVNLFYRVMAS